MTEIDASALRALALKLARTLGEAHRAGRLHLALSPRRIVLPQGGIEGYGSAVDDAFAAPEQLWQSSPVGTWTDVYGLGVVLIALASPRPATESATIVGALGARKQSRSLSALPEDMRATVARMIEADPAKRLQTMAGVVALLEGRPVPPARAHLHRRLHWGMAVLVAALLCAVGASMWSFFSRPEAPVARAFRPKVPAEERVRRAIEASLKDVACSWLDIGYPQTVGGRIRVDASGAAALPAGEIAQKLRAAAGARVAVDTAAIIGIDRRSCAMLDALRLFREPTSEHGRALDAKQAQFHLQAKPQSCRAPDAKQAQVVVDTRPGGGDFALFLVDAKGAVKPLYADRASFEAARRKDADAIGDRGGAAYRLTFCTAVAGPAGLLLLKGQGPFEIGDQPGAFADKAWAKGWTTQMAWYRVLDD